MEICPYSIVDGKEDTYYIQNNHIYINIYLEICGKILIKMLVITFGGEIWGDFLHSFFSD